MKIRLIFRYALYFLLFALFSFAEARLNIRPFAVAFLFALVYCRQNTVALIPLYMGAAMLASFTISALIIAAVPCLIAGIAQLVHGKIKHKLTLPLVSLYLAVSQIPLLFVAEYNQDWVIRCLISIIGAQIMQYCFMVTSYLLLEKKVKFKLSVEETLACGAALAAFGGCLVPLSIDWYMALPTACAFVVLCGVFIDRKLALLISVAMGLGACCTAGRTEYLGMCALFGLMTACFGKEYYIYAGVGIVAIDAIYRLYFGAFGGFTFFSMIAPAAGVMLFVCLPKRLKLGLSAVGMRLKEKGASRMIINRDRQILAEKLSNLSRVFSEVGEILHIEAAEKQETADTASLTEEICMRCCSGCAGLTSCKEALGGCDTQVVVRSLVLAAMDNGKATILDTPQFLSARCRKINGMIAVTNDLSDRYRANMIKQAQVDEGREIVGYQMEGVSRLIEELKADVEKKLSYDSSLEEKLSEELQKYNIGVSDAVVYGYGDSRCSVTMSVKEEDINKKALLETVSEIMGVQMKLIKSDYIIKGMLAAHYAVANVYSVVYGDRSVSKDEEAPNGDRHKVVKISDNRVMLILADGMGSGVQAHRTSGYALELIESFYRAGFDYRTVISTVGKLLSARGTEEFNAVDIASIDVCSGEIDFIKVGGRESFIVCNGIVDVIECGSLPMGIEEEIVPIVEQRKLNTSAFAVLVSDGVIDALGRENLVSLLEKTSTSNPDVLAEEIIVEVKRLQTERTRDDASVLVARIYKEVG